MWEERNLDAWTKVYNASSNEEGAITSVSTVDRLSQLASAPNLESLRAELTNIVTSNIETILSILRSVWSVVVMNISLLSTAVGAILGLVLGFGFDLINFLVETIVFLTVVYYLLASSDEQWLPIKWVRRSHNAFVSD